MLLITDPNNTLIGMRSTQAEANQLIEDHAMVLTVRKCAEVEIEKRKILTDDEATQLYNQLFAQYKIEEVT
jgi:hypothetical protein